MTLQNKNIQGISTRDLWRRWIIHLPMLAAIYAIRRVPDRFLTNLRLSALRVFPLLIFSALLFSPIANAEPRTMLALAKAAIERTHQHVIYDGSYYAIDYPNGDVPKNRGVCTDVVIRSYRALGIDLQKEVHEDIKQHFNRYPAKRIWRQNSPDKNIDHRRVPNLQAYFSRHGQSLPPSDKANNYQTGDIVTWMLPGNLPHIGIVTHKRDKRSRNPMIAHNIGAGPVIENMLFSYPISGHYRYMKKGEN